jgi:nicotinamidase-related amidase
MPAEAKRALVVIDVQNDYVTGDLPIEYPDVNGSLGNICAAMDAAREAGIPIVVVQTSAPAGTPIFAKGSTGWELHETVRSRAWDHYIEKLLPSAFAGTDLAEWVAAKGVNTLAVTGYMTHNCDAATILEAAHAGLAVEFLSDAAGSLPYENRAGSATAEELHRVFSVMLQSRFAAVLTTAEWIQAVREGRAPERDSIYGSNRRARSRRAAAG